MQLTQMATCPGHSMTHCFLGVVAYAFTDWLITSRILSTIVSSTSSNHFSTMPFTPAQRAPFKSGRETRRFERTYSQLAPRNTLKRRRINDTRLTDWGWLVGV